MSVGGGVRLGGRAARGGVRPHYNRHFLTLHPGVQVEVSFLGREDLRVKLINFELDVGITYIGQKQPAPLTSFPLYEEHLSLLVPEDRRFPAATTTWSGAADLPLCLLSPHMHERQIIDAAFASVGKSPKPAIESDSIVDLALHPLLAGTVTIVPSHFEIVIGAFPGTRLIKLVEPEGVRQHRLIL